LVEPYLRNTIKLICSGSHMLNADSEKKNKEIRRYHT